MESFLKNYMNFYKQEVVVDAGEECEEDPEVIKPVSYTHLTLPTKLAV